MRRFSLDRRAFLLGGLVALGLPHAARAAEDGIERFASAARLADGRFAVVIVTGDGRVERTIPLPDRGHDVAVAPDRHRAVVFARRPGAFAVAFDLEGVEEPQLLQAPSGRHFYGHGVFSPDGRLLYATENDWEGERGVVGVYDATARFRRQGEFPSFGAGPHELLLDRDGRTLVVANGGIETHPDSGRAALNLAEMVSSVVRIDARHGARLEEHRLGDGLSQVSLRHMTFAADGAVWIGCQHQGPETERSPLLFRLSRDDRLDPVAMPDALLPRLRNYLGSVAASRDGALVAVSAPRGDRILLFDAAGRFRRAIALADGCGLAPAGAASIAASGGGRLLDLGDDWTAEAGEKLEFDNHLTAM